MLRSGLVPILVCAKHSDRNSRLTTWLCSEPAEDGATQNEADAMATARPKATRIWAGIMVHQSPLLMMFRSSWKLDHMVMAPVAVAAESSA
jgi:hypothetical protein